MQTRGGQDASVARTYPTGWVWPGVGGLTSATPPFGGQAIVPREERLDHQVHWRTWIVSFPQGGPGIPPLGSSTITRLRELTDGESNPRPWVLDANRRGNGIPPLGSQIIVAGREWIDGERVTRPFVLGAPTPWGGVGIPPLGAVVLVAPQEPPPYRIAWLIDRVPFVPVVTVPPFGAQVYVLPSFDLYRRPFDSWLWGWIPFPTARPPLGSSVMVFPDETVRLPRLQPFIWSIIPVAAPTPAVLRRFADIRRRRVLMVRDSV